MLEGGMSDGEIIAYLLSGFMHVWSNLLFSSRTVVCYRRCVSTDRISCSISIMKVPLEVTFRTAVIRQYYFSGIIHM